MLCKLFNQMIIIGRLKLNETLKVKILPKQCRLYYYYKNTILTKKKKCHSAALTLVWCWIYTLGLILA